MHRRVVNRMLRSAEAINFPGLHARLFDGRGFHASYGVTASPPGRRRGQVPDGRHPANSSPRNQMGHGIMFDMRATIELPEPVFHLLQARAEQRSSSIQAVILEAIQKEIAHGPAPADVKGRVSLPAHPLGPSGFVAFANEHRNR